MVVMSPPPVDIETAAAAAAASAGAADAATAAERGVEVTNTPLYSTCVEYIVQLDGTSAEYFAMELQGRTQWLQASLTRLQQSLMQ